MFKRAYEIAQDLGNPVIAEDARIKLGIAVAHHVLGGICGAMNDINKPNLQRLLDFKSARLDTFGGELQPEQREGPSSRAEVVPELSNQQSTSEESGVAENSTPNDEITMAGDDDQQPEDSENTQQTEQIETKDESERKDSGVNSEHEESKDGP